jgi:hypothetical protein
MATSKAIYNQLEALQFRLDKLAKEEAGFKNPVTNKVMLGAALLLVLFYLLYKRSPLEPIASDTIPSVALVSGGILLSLAHNFGTRETRRDYVKRRANCKRDITLEGYMLLELLTPKDEKELTERLHFPLKRLKAMLSLIKDERLLTEDSTPLGSIASYGFSQGLWRAGNTGGSVTVIPPGLN